MALLSMCPKNMFTFFSWHYSRLASHTRIHEFNLLLLFTVFTKGFFKCRESSHILPQTVLFSSLFTVAEL